MSSNSTSDVTAHHVTLLGNGLGNSDGVLAVASPSGGNTAKTNVTITGSIVRGFVTSLARFGGGGESNLTIDWSDYEPTKSDSGPGQLVEGANKLDVDPGLRDPAASPPNLRLRGDSPLIDAGDPAGLATGESTTDVDGKPRIAGGRADIGAAEYQGKPTAALTAAPNSALVGQAVTFDATGSASPESAVAGYAWDLDGDGSFETDTGPMPTAQHTYAAAGDVPVKVRVTALDAGSSEAGLTLGVNALPVDPAPIVTKFRLTKRKFRVGKRVRFRWILSEPAKVAITIARKKGGKFKRTGKPRRRAAPLGPSSLPFRGRKRGRYRATIVATDTAGHKSRPRRLKFRIVRKRR